MFGPLMRVGKKRKSLRFFLAEACYLNSTVMSKNELRMERLVECGGSTPLSPRGFWFSWS